MSKEQKRERALSQIGYPCAWRTRMMRETGGASRDRTDDPLLAKQVLSQLSYGPITTKRRPIDAGRQSETHTTHMMVGLGRLELPTSRLSGVRSNHLSYRPIHIRVAPPQQRADTPKYAKGMAKTLPNAQSVRGKRAGHYNGPRNLARAQPHCAGSRADTLPLRARTRKERETKTAVSRSDLANAGQFEIASGILCSKTSDKTWDHVLRDDP